MPTPTRKAWMAAWEADMTPSPASERSAVRAQARMSHRRYYTREATARIPKPLGESLPEQQVETPRPMPRPRVVTRRRPRWGMIIMALLFVGMVVGASIVVPVLVSAAGTGLEAQLGRLAVQQNELAASNAALSAQISALSSPERVADQATLLGLGPAVSVRYVEIGTGAAVAEGDATVAGR